MTRSALDGEGFTSLDFLRENKEEIEWGFFRYSFFKNEKDMEEFKDKLDWILIVRQHIPLSEKFIDKYKEKWDWYELLKYYKFSEKFLEKHLECLIWDAVSEYQTLSEHFIEKYKDKLNWYYLSGTQYFSYKFMEKYFDYIDWQILEEYNKELTIPFHIYKRVAKMGLWDPYDKELYKRIKHECDF